MAWISDGLRHVIEYETEMEHICQTILNKMCFKVWSVVESMLCPRSINNEFGYLFGKFVGKRTAKEGMRRANVVPNIEPSWAQKRKISESTSSFDKRSGTNRDGGFGQKI